MIYESWVEAVVLWFTAWYIAILAIEVGRILAKRPNCRFAKLTLFLWRIIKKPFQKPLQYLFGEQHE